jgi:hypothetical protein
MVSTAVVFLCLLWKSLQFNVKTDVLMVLTMYSVLLDVTQSTCSLVVKQVSVSEVLSGSTFTLQ